MTVPVEAPPWVPPGPGAVELLAAAGAGAGVALAEPLVGGAIRSALAGLAPRDVHTPAPAPGAGTPGEVFSGPSTDPGWFGPHSVAWRIHADTSMFVAGLTAFALQALHPLALAGVVDHSAFAEDFLGRLRRTGDFVAGVVYGTAEEAAARCATVRRIHRRVVGVAPDGRPYTAEDPDLLGWVHVAEYLAIGAAYRRFGLRPLALGDLDRYIDEVAVVGTAVGVTAPPRSWAELDAVYRSYLPALAVGEQAVDAVRFLRDPPGLDGAARTVWRSLWAGASVCLPPSARALLGVRAPLPGRVAACRALLHGVGAALGPPPLAVAARRRVDAATPAPA